MRRKAGYRCPQTIGPRLLKKKEIKAAIDARVATAALTTSELLARLADIATADLLDFIDVDKVGKVTVNMDRVKKLGLGHLIKRMRIRKDGTTEIDLEPRMAAMIKLGEYMKLWKRDAEPQLTLVDVAKSLKEKYERLKHEGYAEGHARLLQRQADPVQ